MPRTTDTAIIVEIAEDASADAKHHRAVPCDERRESGFIALVNKALKQHPVREIARSVSDPTLHLR